MSNLPLIAVVDDDCAMREAFIDLLQAAGFSCRAYAGATDFLDDFQPDRFGLVITDLRMPRMGGIELLRRLRAADAALPAIVVTSCSDAATRACALREGAVAYLTKPVDNDRLIELIARVLGGAANRPAAN